MSKVQVNTLQSFEQPEKVVDVRDLSSAIQTVSEHSTKLDINQILIFESLRRSYAEAGFNLVNGSFEVGGSLINSNDVLLLKSQGIAYSYSGTLPHDVAPATDPTEPDSGYVSVASSMIRGDLASNNTGKGSSLIGTLSGLTVQQVLDHLSRQFSNAFFNVKDYGAVGDGIADDTIAIQNAINAALNGGTLYFPHGTYITTQPLNLSGKK